MSRDVLNFLPMAGLLLGLLVAFAFDPTVDRVPWWTMAVGLASGYVARFGLKRYYDAR